MIVFGLKVKNQFVHEVGELNDPVNAQAFQQKVETWKVLDFPAGEKLMAWYGEEHSAINFSELRQPVGTSLRYFLNLFIIPILSFFILKDGREIRDGLLGIFDNSREAGEFLTDAHRLLLEYMRALLGLCLATLISFTIALKLMDVPYAILLGLLSFPLEFIPLVGSLTSAVIIIGVSAFNGYHHIGLVIGFLFGYRLFQDYVLSPYLMKRGVKLHPLLVLSGIFAGGEIGNIPGIFLSVPVLALLRLVFYGLRRRRIARQHLYASHWVPITFVESE